MRIFFVTNNYIPYSGGVVSSIISMTDALRAQGHEIFIITLDFLGMHNHCDPDYVIRISCPIKFMYKKNHMAIPWRATHRIEQLIKHYKPDIVHVHHPFLLGVSGAYAARRLGVVCIFTYHSMYEQYAHYVPLPRSYAQLLIKSAVIKFCNSVDGIIAPSNAVKEYLIAQKVTTPIEIIPSSLRSFFVTNDVSNLNIYNRTPYNLLFVGRFVSEKNIPFIFDVFKHLPDIFTLTLVGYGVDYEVLRRLAFEKLHLSEKRVNFVYKPSQDELLYIYRNAGLFIFPSQTDTQAIVLAEAMSQGLPVVALDGPGQQDIIINGVNGFIVKDAQSAVKTIISMVSNMQLYHMLSFGAYEAAQRYHAKNIIKQLLSFYDKIYN